MMRGNRYWPLRLLSVVTCAAAAGEDPPRVNPEVGRKVYTTKCAKCHEFYNPARYTDAQWSKWMSKMSSKAKLTDEQKQAVAQYIAETYRSGKTPATTPIAANSKRQR